MTPEPMSTLESSVESSARRPNPRLGGAVIRRIALPLIGAGAALSAWGAWQSLTRFGFAYLVGWCFVWSVVAGSLFFVALHYATNSLWSLVYRRVAEALASPAILLAVLFIPILLFAGRLYPWLDADYVAAHPSVQAKTLYLNIGFFAVRAVIFLGVWVFFSELFVRASLRACVRNGPPLVAQPLSAVKTLETGRSIAEGFTAGGLRARTAALLCCATIVRHAPRPMRAWSYLFLIVFALTVSFASFDWIMSLSPEWSSTMFGVYLFAGMAVTALSALTLAALGLKRAGALGPEIVNEDHLYSLGALMFAFSCFWGYIALSQYLLIWYGNLPEETVWFVDRWRGDWVGMSLALMGVRFVLPFLALLSRSAKTNPRRLVWVSCFLLAGQVVDLHWMILPQMPGGGPSGGPSAGPVLLLSDAGPLLLLTGLWLAEVGRFVGKHPMIAAGDPQWEESLRFELRI